MCQARVIGPDDLQGGLKGEVRNPGRGSAGRRCAAVLSTAPHPALGRKPARRCVGDRPAMLHGSALEQIQRDVDDHVFLPANHAAPAQFDQNVQGFEAVFGGGDFGMAQEA